MTEVDGIDMVIVFAEMSEADNDSRSDLNSILNSPFGSGASMYVGSRQSALPTPAPRSSARSSGRAGLEGSSARRSRSAHTVRTERRSEEATFSSELPPPLGVFRRDLFRREVRDDSSVPLSFSDPRRGSTAIPPGNTDSAAQGGLESSGGSFVSRFLSSLPLSSRPQTWTQVHSQIPPPPPSGNSNSSESTARSIPPGLEQILQRAFSHISGESMMSEFMRRILESQRRGNPPASLFAIDNLEGSTILSCLPCTICQDDICKGSEAVHMPCKHAFHRECLVPWLQEHNTCPICRCEIESHCARYNQSNFDKLKGPLQPITISNHEDPSRMASSIGGNLPGNQGTSGSQSSNSSHVRMTIRMPFPGPQLTDRTEGSRYLVAGNESELRPPTRFVRPTQPRYSGRPTYSSGLPSAPLRAHTSSRNHASSTPADGAASSEVSAPKRRKRGEVEPSPSENSLAAPITESRERKSKVERTSSLDDVASAERRVDLEAPISARTRTRKVSHVTNDS